MGAYKLLLCIGPLCLFLADGNTFQNLKVSSPAPVTIYYPHGDIAKYNTLYVCPVNVAYFCKEGYFQTII